jgi:hypothetical protein
MMVLQKEKADAVAPMPGLQAQAQEDGDRKGTVFLAGRSVESFQSRRLLALEAESEPIDRQILSAARRAAMRSQSSLRPTPEPQREPKWARQEAVVEAVEEESMDGQVDASWDQETKAAAQVLEAVETPQQKEFESALAMPKTKSPSLERALRAPPRVRTHLRPAATKTPVVVPPASPTAPQLTLSDWSVPPPPEPAEAAPPMPWMQGARVTGHDGSRWCYLSAGSEAASAHG